MNMNRGEMMKSFIVLSVCILFVLSSCFSLCASEARVVRVGAFNYYPGIFKDSDGAVKGFYVDALDDIAKRENIRFEYVYGSWSEGLERIKSGDVDVLTSMAYTPERAEFLDYAKVPLLTVWGELYAPLGSDIDGIRQVQGKKIAVMKGDFNGRNFIELVKKFDISCAFVELPGFEDVFKAVTAKKVDAGVVSSTFGVAKQKEFALRSTGVVFNPFDIFLAVSKGKNQELLALTDNYLDTWRHDNNSVFNQARQKWSHGTINTIQIYPRWITNIAMALGTLVAGSILFIVLLRRRVRRAIADALKSKAVEQESEAKFRSYIDNSPDGVFVADKNGCYVEVNRAASAITGYSEEELLRMSLPDLLPQESLEIALSHFQILKESGSSSSEFEFLHKTGNKRWWSVDAVKLSENRCLGFAKDITHRKLIEETQLFILHSGSYPSGGNFFESLAQYLATALEMDYVCIDRLQGDCLAAQTVAVYHNGSFKNNVAYTLKDTPCADVVGKDICVFPTGVRNLFPEDEALQDLQAESYLGTTLWSFDMKPIGLIAVISRLPLANRTLSEEILKLVAIRAAGELERTIAEEALRESNAYLENLINYANAPIIVWDPQFRITRFNHAFEFLTGRNEAEVIGQSLEILFPPELTTHSMALIHKTLTGERWETVEIIIQHRDGSVRTVLWNSATLFGANGQTPVATIAQGHDITVRKQYEKELLNKNIELERFSYTVSHDLKSPLITIESFAGSITKDIETGNLARVQGDIKRITDAAAKMTALLNDILELSRAGRTIDLPTHVDMNRLVKGVLTQLAGSLRQSSIEVLVQPDLTPVYGDEKRIAGVVQNLIENSTKYIGEQIAPRIEIGTRQDGKESVFFVRDNGKGIAPRDCERIFGLFNKLDTGSEGTGVGLALVKRIIEAHGGRAWVESEGVGTGSTFCFTIVNQSNR